MKSQTRDLSGFVLSPSLVEAATPLRTWDTFSICYVFCGSLSCGLQALALGGDNMPKSSSSSGGIYQSASRWKCGWVPDSRDVCQRCAVFIFWGSLRKVKIVLRGMARKVPVPKS